MHQLKILLIICSTNFFNVFGLDLEKLESLGISINVYISDIAVHFNKAFLAVPRTTCQNNISSPTLVEVPWKEYNVILKSSPNPGDWRHFHTIFGLDGMFLKSAHVPLIQWELEPKLIQGISYEFHNFSARIKKGSTLNGRSIVTVYIRDKRYFVDKVDGLGDICKDPKNGNFLGPEGPTSTSLEGENLGGFNKPLEEGQIWAKCDHLQNAISLAKESVKSKLWILDKGNKYCPAKLIAYSMFHNIFIENDVIELAEVPKNQLNSLVIENDSKLGNHRAFIAGAGDNTILACYLTNLDCIHVQLLQEGHRFSHIFLDNLSISKTDSKMYFTGNKALQVMSLDIDDLPQELTKNESFLSINVSFLGEKLGYSSGLETDLKDGLIYYLIKDYAVVRWISGETMDAEHHDVLVQSYKQMPYVSRLFSDPQGSVYALINPFSPEKCLREAIFQNTSKTFTLERVVKIMKYNWFLDTFY